MAQEMKAIHVVSGPASMNASAIAHTPSAMIPSIGVALRLISAKSRTIAVEWLGMASGSERDRRASRSWMVILRRRVAASEADLSPLPLPPRSAPTSRIARPTRTLLLASIMRLN